jgi:hypothetical protein
VRFLRAHLYFACALTAAAALRAVAVAAYFPALWFNDSFDYVRIGLAPFPHPLRPDGYGLLLWMLRPLHSFALVTVVQHLMGLATGTMVYALPRHRFGVAGWAACLAAVPVLFDAYQIELEHLVMSYTLFMFLTTCAITVVLWRPAVTWRAGAVAGVLLALAALTRTVGIPLIAVMVVFLIIRRTLWRAAGAAVLAAGLPLVAYALWFQSVDGRLAIVGTDGVFLWGRTAAFADCAKIGPPPDLARLCPRGPVGRRAASSSQIWQSHSPMGWRAGHPFDPVIDRQARRFALIAIAAQPGDYAATVGHGLALTFGWHRHPYPSAYTSALYRFPRDPLPVPDVPVIEGGSAVSVVRAYSGTYHGVKVTEPYAGWSRGYQRQVFVRGPVLAVIFMIGLVGVVRRRPGAALSWAVAVCLLMTPLLTADFDYRYVLPAVPVACVAAVLACRGRTARTVLRGMGGERRRSPRTESASAAVPT